VPELSTARGAGNLLEPLGDAAVASAHKPHCVNNL